MTSALLPIKSAVHALRYEGEPELFSATSILEWLPSETLFSLISRQHHIAGYHLSTVTATQYFGHSRQGAQHDLPSHLSMFVTRTQGALGQVDAIAKERTLLAYYKAFIPEAELQNTIACMAKGSVAHLKMRLGILTSRFRANHPLKACPECMAADRINFGWSYWHLEHQFPGVWVCPIHGVPLRESLLKSTGVERFSWQLPTLDTLRDEEPWHKLVSESPQHGIHQFSELVAKIVRQAAACPIDTTRLLEAYRSELLRRQWLTPNGSLRMPAIARSFVDHCRNLREIPELSALPATFEQSKTQLGRLLRPARSGTHPLRHLVLIHWLFGSCESFWRTYADSLVAGDQQKLDVQDDPLSTHPRVDDSRRVKLLQLLTAKNLSFRQAASHVGIDVGTAMTWAGQAGIQVSRRPKKLTMVLRMSAIAALHRGSDKAEVAARAGVSVVTITKILLTEVGLHAAWQEARHQKAQNHSRKIWQRLLHRFGVIGVKYMRSMEPAAYAWLYRNDRAWLEHHTPPARPRTTSVGAPRIAWDERDRALSAEVERAVLSLYEQRKLPIRLWQIYQMVPALKPKLTVLERLPLTKRAIDHALSRSKALAASPHLFS